MSRHDDKKQPHQRVTIWKVFYSVTILIGGVLMVFEIKLFHRTFIAFYIPLLIIISVGAALYLLIRKHYNRVYDYKGWLYPLLQSTLSWGFMSCYLFMAINYYPGGNDSRDLELRIISKSSMPGHPHWRRHPIATVDYEGFEKQLIFDYPDTKFVENADKIAVTAAKGFLGYDIVVHYRVVVNDKNEAR